MLFLCLLTFLDLVGFGIVIPIMPLLVENYQLTPLQTGLLVSSFFVAQFVGAIIIGHLSDLYGKKLLLSIALFGLIIGYFGHGFIQTVSANFIFLVIFRVIIGIFSGNIAVTFATVYSFSTEDNLIKNMSYLGGAFTLGFIFGPTLGGYLSNNHDSILPFYCTGSFYVLCFLLTIIFFKEPPIPDSPCYRNIFTSIIRVFQKPNILFPLSLFAIYAFVFAGLEVFLLTYTLGLNMQFSPLYIGLVWTYFAIILTSIQIFITKYIPPHIAIIGGWLICGVMIMSLSLAFNIYSILFVLLIIAFSFAIVFPNINADLSLMGTQRQKGLVFGLNFAAESVGGASGPYILSYVYDITGQISTVWVVSGIIPLLMGLISMYYCIKKGPNYPVA